MTPLGFFRRTRFARLSAAALAAVVLAAASLHAQQIIRGGRSRGTPPVWPEAHDFDGHFMYCRGFTEPQWRTSSGSGWSTDYPAADSNFSVRVAELTKVPVKFRENRQPHHVVVPLVDPLLYHCPMLFMSDIGAASFSGEEVQRLREFFFKGGFLWVDDSWGSIEWSTWVEQISRVLPPGEFPIFDIPLTHPVMRTLYNVPDVPQIPSIQRWNGTGGGTSELGADSAEVYFKGIQDARGRLMVVMTHNTDIADGWEREGEDPAYFDLFSPRAYALGVNILLYALTH